MIHVSSIKLFFLIESNECFSGNDTFSIRVTISNHLSDLSRCDIFLQFLGACNQIFGGNKSLVLLVNVGEDSINVVLGVLIAGVGCHQLNELLEANFSSFIKIEVGHCDVDEASGRVVASVLFNSFSEVKGSQHPVVVIIEVVEYLFEHLNISFVSISCDKLFGVKIDISLRVPKAAFHFLLRGQPSVFAEPKRPLATPIFA